MIVEPRTLIIIVGMIQFLQAGVLFQQYAINRRSYGIKWWLLWSVLEIFAFLIMVIRITADVNSSIVLVQNVAIILGAVFLYIGIIRFLGLVENKRGLIIFSILSAGVMAYFTFVENSVTARIFFISLIVSGFAFMTAGVLFMKKSKAVALSANFTSFVFFAHGCAFLLRALLVLAGFSVKNVIEPSILNYLAYLDTLAAGFLGTIGFILMINQRLNSELLDNNERFESVFNSTPDGMIIARFPDFVISDVNSGFLSISGFDRGDLIGKTCKDVRAWSATEGIEHFIGRSIAEQCRRDLDMTLQTKQGSIIDVMVSIKVIKFNGTDHMLIVVRDISARKKTERSLVDSESRYRNLITYSPDAIFVNSEDKLILVNKACVRLFGAKSQDDLLGKSPYQLIHPDYHLLIRERINAMRTAKVPAPAVEEKIIRMDGTALDVDVLAAPFDFQGASYIHVILRDISDRKKAQDELTKVLKKEIAAREVMASMLEDNNQIRQKLEATIEEVKQTQNMLVQSEKLASLGRLVSEMAHEVNNPLMIISGNAQLAKMSDKIDPETQNYLSAIMMECQRAKSIVQRLLKFSRASKGDTKPVDINKSLDSVIGIMEQQLKLVNIEIKRAYWPNLPEVMLDEQQMQEVFMNLIGNAVDAMANGGSIVISTLKRDNHIKISFKDSGCGMTDEVKKRFMEPFFTTKEKGTGLGMAVCYGIIKAHNGDLMVESEVDKGTTVTVVLPCD